MFKKLFIIGTIILALSCAYFAYAANLSTTSGTTPTNLSTTKVYSTPTNLSTTKTYSTPTNLSTTKAYSTPTNLSTTKVYSTPTNLSTTKVYSTPTNLSTTKAYSTPTNLSTTKVYSTPSYSTNSSSYSKCTSASCYSSYSSYSSSKKTTTTKTYAVYTPPSCTNECSINGQRVCDGSGYKTCGQYDSDSCLEWSSITPCPSGYTCSNGQCVLTCTNECSINGQRVCDGSGYKTCGQYDSDSCLEWSSITPCPSGYACSNGQCVLSCTNECSVNGQRVCDGNGWKQCGNHDSDSCLEWGSITWCASDETCNNGSCVKSCTNECSVNGQRVCDGSGYKTCGQYDSDSCLEWSSITQCAWNQTCSNGQCVDTCQNECTYNQHECSGSSGRTCLKNSQGCTYWGNWNSCDSQCYHCGDGRCECGETKSSCPQDCGYNTPTVNLDYHGSVKCGQKATLTWTSTNADSCYASGGWSGTKSTSGSEQVGNFTGSRTFSLNCTGDGGTASDSVIIYGTADDLDVDAGPDKYIDANESVRLDGSVDGDYDYLRWSCTGGNLSDYDILRPTYRAPYYDYDYSRTYTCTLTARNECGSDSDTMRVRVDYDDYDREFDVSLIARPKSDCAPLYDVDLVATVSNWRDYDYDYDFGDSYRYYDREFTYYFDCENDGAWDKTVTTDDTSYTALNLCDYHNVGSYTARVRVERGNRTATDTEIVRAESCGISQVGNVNITKTVSNLSAGGGYQGTVTANPLNVVSYKITVTGTSGTATNVTVTDAVPGGLTNIRDVQVDGYATGGNLASGISLGTITSGQTRTITYTATVANENSFVYGQTTLNNVATVTVDGKSANSNAAVVVYRQAVMGATTISTGIGSDTIIALGIALLAALACLIWVAKDNIAGLFKRKAAQTYEY